MLLFFLRELEKSKKVPQARGKHFTNFQACFAHYRIIKTIINLQTRPDAVQLLSTYVMKVVSLIIYLSF